jgi:K+-transporting ATPase ATPase C chain
MRRQLRPAILVLILLTLLTGVIYPLTVTGLAQVLFPAEANGSILVRGGVPVGSVLVGQSFTAPGYFWGRPSNTPDFPYNAASSAGDNEAPTNPAMLAAVRDRVAALRAVDPGNTAPVPVDLVVGSGSGLDPEISPAAARYQAGRVARARGLTEARVLELVRRYTRGRTLGVLGEPGVNVLKLNLALDSVRPLRAAVPAR